MAPVGPRNSPERVHPHSAYGVSLLNAGLVGF